MRYTLLLWYISLNFLINYFVTELPYWFESRKKAMICIMHALFSRKDTIMKSEFFYKVLIKCIFNDTVKGFLETKVLFFK